MDLIIIQVVIPIPYASINFEGPSGGNGFPSSGNNKNNAFAPTGNDYLKF